MTGKKGGPPTAPRSLRLRCVATSCGRCGDLVTHAIERVLTYDDPRPHGWCDDCRSEDNRTRPRDRSKPSAYIRPREQSRRHNRERFARLQAATRDQAERDGRPWTEAEWEVVADGSLTTKQVALEIGRSYASVASHRARLINPPTSPTAEARARMKEAVERAQQETLAAAHHHYDMWTGPELEFLMRDDGLSIRQKAEALGRTYQASSQMRRKCLRDPRKVSMVGGDGSERP